MFRKMLCELLLVRQNRCYVFIAKLTIVKYSNRPYCLIFDITTFYSEPKTGGLTLGFA